MAKSGRLGKVKLAEVQRAKKEIDRFLSPTPLVKNAWLSDEFGCEVYLKLENMQPIGSFKLRGATYKISRLSAEQRKRGVIAASAGNHAQGVAWGSRQFGVNSLIVMPESAPIVKFQNTQALGAEVILKGRNYDQAYAAAREISEKTKRVFIHAFDDQAVIAGQGTVALELLQQLSHFDYFVAAVGGGGLLAGASSVLKALKPEIQIVGVQARGAPSMIESVRKGKAVQLSATHTFADGIAVTCASENLRKILAPLVDDWVAVDETEIATAVLTLLEKAKTTVEGSGAVPLAALEHLRGKIRGKKVVLVVSGGNIDVNVLSRIIDVGLLRAGRRVRVHVLISDRPGSLAQLTDLVGRQGANIIQAIHDRNEPSVQIDQTEVALTLETRGPEHSLAVVESLKKQVFRLELAHSFFP